MDRISTTNLTNGELISLGAIEIVSFPHVNIIDTQRMQSLSNISWI